jgi:hypothetical protein
MKHSASNSVFGILVVGLLMILGLSSHAMGQGRGRRVSHLDRKCEKFVNCHDARDGRVDGRGPDRRDGLSNVIFRRSRRNRDSDVLGRRDRYRDRDLGRNRSWRRRR